MKTYVTFGQEHEHKINGIIFDRNCVAVIDALNAKAGREKAFKLFGEKFCFAYAEKNFSMSSLKFFPRGLINVVGENKQ